MPALTGNKMQSNTGRSMIQISNCKKEIIHDYESERFQHTFSLYQNEEKRFDTRFDHFIVNGVYFITTNFLKSFSFLMKINVEILETSLTWLIHPV